MTSDARQGEDLPIWHPDPDQQDQGIPLVQLEEQSNINAHDGFEVDESACSESPCPELPTDEGECDGDSDSEGKGDQDGGRG